MISPKRNPRRRPPEPPVSGQAFFYRVRAHGVTAEEVLSPGGLPEPTGVEEGEGFADLWFADRASAEMAARLLAHHNPETVASPWVNWNRDWQSRWTPVEVGSLWWIAPDGESAPPPPGRLRLTYHAGTAFGNGDHPTTHLCLEVLERLRPGEVFLDVGCGSGLLLEAARLMGARLAAGCDTDRSAVVDARRRGGDVMAGSLDAIAGASVDVAVMNIHLAVIRELVRDFLRILRPGGWGVVSGFLEEQREEVRRLGLPVESVQSRDGWCAAVIRPGADSPPRG